MTKTAFRLWPLATAFALTGLLSAILLTGASVWFLGAVALAGAGPAALAFNFHAPAAFIRLFALTKTAAKYGERLAGHRAALLDQVERRKNLFVAMALAPAVRCLGWQLGNQDRLSDYMDDVEDLDFARLRTVIPQLTMAVAAAALVAATLWVAPLALLPISGITVMLCGALIWVRRRVAESAVAMRATQRAAGDTFGAGFSALAPLKAEGAWPLVLQDAFAHLQATEAARLRQQQALAALDAVSGSAGPLAAFSVLAAAWYAGQSAEALLVSAFLAFSWLAFGETVQTASRILLGGVRADLAGAALSDWHEESATGAETAPLGAVSAFELASVPRIAIDGRRLGEPLSVIFHPGQPTALTGPSGSGKTTLLKQIAGWLDGGADCYRADGTAFDSSTRRATSHLSLHDAAILEGSVRDNLFAPQASDGECWHALTVVEMVGRVMAAGGLDGWITQDMLSSGEAQRLNLARALLSRSPIVLFDEPGEHLDAAQSKRIFSRILTALKGRIVVYSSHDLALVEAAGRIDLS